jgi:trimeric autotransporter adhesin
MTTRLALPLLLSLAAFTSLAACGGGPSIHSITLTEAVTGPLVSIGETRQLTGTALDAAGKPLQLTLQFTSSVEAVATVSASGLVTAVSDGTTAIKAALGDYSASLDLTVAQATASMVVTPASIRVPPGEEPAFFSDALDALGHPMLNGPVPVWSSSDPALLTVDASGRGAVSGAAPTGATARAIASAGAIASTGGGVITVDPAAVYVEGILIAPGYQNVLSSLGETVQLTAEASNHRLGDVTAQVTIGWTSSDPTIATVTATGLVTAVANGNVTITASVSGASASAPVNVTQEASAVVVLTSGGARSATISSLGDTVQLVATADDPGGHPVAGASFTWSSDNASVATVDATGLVTAVKNGTANITAKVGNNRGLALPVTVQQQLSFVDVTGGTAFLDAGTTLQLGANPRDGKGNTIAGAAAATWTSSNAAVATISTTGLVTAVAAGSVTFSATVSGVTGTATLKVVPAPAIVEWNFGTAAAGSTVTITVGQAVIWRNSVDGVAHTATADVTPPPATGQLGLGSDSAPQRFTTAGTVKYHCSNHSYMVGTVIVTP